MVLLKILALKLIKGNNRRGSNKMRFGHSPDLSGLATENTEVTEN